MDALEKKYWKDRRAHSLFLAAVLAFPLSILIWFLYQWIYQAGHTIYLVTVVSSAFQAVAVFDVQTFSYGGALLSILIFSVFAWLLERKTKRAMFWWYPIIVLLFELSKLFSAKSLENLFVISLGVLTLVVILEFLNGKKN